MLKMRTRARVEPRGAQTAWEGGGEEGVCHQVLVGLLLLKFDTFDHQSDQLILIRFTHRQHLGL